MVSDEGLATYLDVDPDDMSDTVEGEFPIGTIIIKEMFSDTGDRTGFTVMAKGGEGGASATNDWWWGMYAADGTLNMGGSIGFCIECHEGNGLSRTDWVRGVPMSDR